MLMLPKHNRYEYSAIGERKDYSWPGGKRLAFCVTTNIEVYAYRKGTGWDPAKKGEPQQQRNYSWRDYGNRVGIWRLFDLFDQLKLPAAHNINSLLYDYHPQICSASGHAATRLSAMAEPMRSVRAICGNSTSAV
jgi:allantoinase